MITAIDIGSESVKVVTLKMKKGTPMLVGAGLGSLQDIDRAADDYPAQIARVLTAVIRKNKIPLGRTLIGLGGRGSMIRYLGVPIVPPWKLALFMSLEVDEQVGSGSESAQVAYDYRILNLPDFEDDQFPVFLALAQVAVIEERMKICRQGARTAHDVGLHCLGAFNLFRFTPPCQDETVSVLLDVGAEETHLTIQQGEHLYFARTISWGGRQITAKIQKDLRLLPTDAEDVKCAEARIVPREEEEFFNEKTVTLSRACRSEIGQLANGVLSSVRFFQNQFKLPALKPTKIFVTGGGASVPGLPEALSLQVRLPVERLDLTGTILPAKTSDHPALTPRIAPFFSTTVGLALGALTGGFSVSLVPPSVKDKRDFWSRRVYAAYTAAVGVAILALLVFIYHRDALAQDSITQQGRKEIKAMKAEYEMFAKLKRENKNRYKQVAALQTRKDSAIDLFVSLAHLRELTPSNIFYIRLATTTQPWVSSLAGSKAPAILDLKNTSSEFAKAVPSVTFQQDRSFLVTGYVVDVIKEEEGRQVLTRLIEQLDALDLFRKVDMKSSKFLPEDGTKAPAEVLAAYGRAFARGDKKKRKLPRHGALNFTLRFDVAEPMSKER